MMLSTEHDAHREKKKKDRKKRRFFCPFFPSYRIARKKKTKRRCGLLVSFRFRFRFFLLLLRCPSTSTFFPSFNLLALSSILASSPTDLSSLRILMYKCFFCFSLFVCNFKKNENKKERPTGPRKQKRKLKKNLSRAHERNKTQKKHTRGRRQVRFFKSLSLSHCFAIVVKYEEECYFLIKRKKVKRKKTQIGTGPTLDAATAAAAADAAASFAASAGVVAGPDDALKVVAEESAEAVETEEAAAAGFGEGAGCSSAAAWTFGVFSAAAVAAPVAVAVEFFLVARPSSSSSCVMFWI